MEHSVLVQRGPKLSMCRFLTVCFLFSVAFGFAMVSDLFVSSTKIEASAIIFRSLPNLIFSLALLAALFLSIGILIVWITLKDSTWNARKLLWRRFAAILLSLILFLLLCFSVVYLANKQVVVTSESIRLETFFSTREVWWSNSEVVNYNFVVGTRLGPPFTRRPYAFIEFRTKGEVVHFDLRFIGNDRLLEQLTRQYISLEPYR